MLRNFTYRLFSVLEGSSDRRLDEELPFGAMMITLMAASGVTPYESFRRLRQVDALQRFREEGDEIVRQVEILGHDPLTSMEKRAEHSKSKSYAEFLEGYISSVKSGGSVINYLTSKLRNIFDIKTAQALHSIERLETLVEAYMIMLIVIFCFYILSSVTSITSMGVLDDVFPETSQLIYPLILFVVPLFSLIFMYLANNVRRGTLREVKKPYILAVIPGSIFAAIILLMKYSKTLSSTGGLIELPLLITIGLVSISILPALSYRNIAQLNISAENAMPNFLRDVTEARRTGLSPEKSIVHAASRRGYGPFTQYLKRIINQIEWGVSLRRIYSNLKEWIMSWPVVIDFLILVETIEIGGGEADTLSLLAEFSERSQTIEKSQRDMLKPYILLPFIWSILMAFTVTFTIYTMSQAQVPLVGGELIPSASVLIVESGMIFQCWLSGFFIGKVSEGSIASGFKYAATLAITVYVTLYVSHIVIETLFWRLVA